MSALAGHRNHEAPIRVLVLFSTSEIGGAERSLTRMALACRDTAIAYELATVGGEGKWAEWLRGQGISHTCFRVFLGRRISLRGLVGFFRSCRRCKPHIIYAVGLRAAFIARLAKCIVPRMKVVHGIRSTYPAESQLARAFRWSEMLLNPWTAAYIANSQRGAADLLGLVKAIPARKMSVIYNGVRLAEPAAAAAQREMSIAVVANISSYKGHEAFLDVVQRVRRSIPEVSVLFIGRNDAGADLEQSIRQRELASTVRLLGYHPRPEELVRAVRVVSLPSPQIEGCPTSVLEAMSMGIPVVAYDVGGLQEIIVTGVSGELVRPRDTEGFAAALINTLCDYELNDQLGKAARRLIETRFTLEICAAAHARRWRALVNQLDELSN